jgi:hypothetical protein
MTPKAFLVTTARNEAPYYLEWVAHHLEVGFTDIVIFQNDSDDLTHETLSVLREIGAIQYFYGRGEPGQHKPHAYARAAKLAAYHGADWAIALDMDEFLVVKAGEGTLTDLLASVPASDCIQLNMRGFGNSGYEMLTDQLVTDAFCMAEEVLGPTDHFAPYKCLFRPALFDRPGQHLPVSETVPQALRLTNGSGLMQGDYIQDGARSNDPQGCLFAQINHYATRDLASFMLKNHAMPQDAWQRRNTNFAIDDSTRPILGRVKARMEALNAASDGRLMDLRERAIFNQLARYYTMLQTPEARSLRQFCKDTPIAAHRRKGAF